MPTEVSSGNVAMPRTVMEHAAKVVEILRAHDQILVSGHINPDGDAIGSSGALVWLLRRMGKQAALYNATGVPDYLNWMPLPGEAYRIMARLPFKPNVLVSLDCGDIWCLGKELAGILPQIACVNVDHHQGNPRFGSLYNWIDPRMAAAGQMVAALADAAGVSLDGELAVCIYVALVTDTGSFSHGNTTADVFRLTARLMDNGLDTVSIRNQLDNQWSMAKLKLWGKLMQQVHLERDGMVGVCMVTMADLANAGACKEDLEGFVEQIRHIRGVRVALLAREDAPGRCKVSLRSTGSDDVRVTAAQFGGGGHKNAAGVTLKMSLDETVSTLVPALQLD